MHKRVHGLQVLAVLLVVLIALLLISQNQPKTSQPIANQEVDLSSYQFSTIIQDKLVNRPSSPAATDKPAIKPTHGSEILKRIDFEQEEYVALLTPNDSNYPLWFYDNIGIPSAWDDTTGSSETVIAVIDSGYALDHQELSNRWHINSGEQGTTAAGDICWDGVARDKQTNNCDDDQNNYVDDWRGWDFYSIDNSPQAGELNPSGAGVAHGTQVAGLIGAAGNNGLGLPGINWQAKIMPLQSLSDNGNGYTSDIVAAVEYAVDNGADIINLSLGGSGNDPAMQAAVSYARANNVVVIAASGNCATLAYAFCYDLEAPGYMGYPALYPEVISVGAVTSAGDRAAFSSYSNSLDIVAPGQSLTITTSWSNTNQTTGYASGVSGTSFSSPIVAGVASLIHAANPNLSHDEYRQVLLGTAVQNPSIGSIYDNEYGFGLVQSNLALNLASSNAASNLNRSNLDQPLISTSRGQDPGDPLGSSEAVTSTITSYGGDQPYIKAFNVNTEQIINFETSKTGDDGVATFDWTADQLGDGVWRLTPHGLQLSGISETIYIGN